MKNNAIKQSPPATKMASEIKVISLSTDGGYITPRITESSKGRKGWVEFGIEGVDDFFTTLIKRYETSPTNQACIDGCTDLIYGKGIKAKDNQVLEDYLYSLTTDEELRRIIFDYKMFGNASIQVVFSPDKSKIIKFYHIPVDSLRAEKVNEEGKIPAYYYSSDWSNKRIIPTRIPAFGSSEYEDNVQIIYFRKYSPGKFYYGIPDYYSSIQYCATEEEISNLHINNIRNNFLPSTIINFNGGVPPEEEKQAIEQAVDSKFTGTDNAGKFILSFNENKDSQTTIQSLKPENLHLQYEFLSEEASRKIMLSHRITSQLLFGIRTATGFSSNADELKVAYEIFQTMVIQPMDKEILQQVQGILGYNRVNGDSLYFSPLIPFGFLSDAIGEAGTADIVEKAIDNTNGPTEVTEEPKSEQI